MDTVSRKRRSEIMRSVKSTDTKPELVIRRFLFSQGYRYRLHDKRLPGKPDIKLSKYNTVIFINGCFWHGHDNCNIYVMPKTNKDYWYNKIVANKKRDIVKINQLKNLGWRVIIIYECELRKAVRPTTFEKLLSKL